MRNRLTMDTSKDFTDKSVIRSCDEKGFTLLELVTAVGVLLVLTVIGLLSYNGITQNSKQAAVNRAVDEVYDRAIGYLLDNDPLTTAQKAENEYNSSSKQETGKKHISVRVDDLNNGRIRVTATYGAGEASAVRETPLSNTGESTEEEDPGIITPPIISGTAVMFYQCDSNTIGRLGFDGVSANSELTVSDGSETKTYSPSDIVEFTGGVRYKVSLIGSYLSYEGKDTLTKDCLREVESFGAGVTKISELGANIELVPETIPKTVNDTTRMFHQSAKFNDDISGWDTKEFTNMYGMFWGASSFNVDIGLWDTGNVRSMYGVFREAALFNQDIGKWNTSRVNDMSYMFQDADTFNQYVGEWDVSQVTRFNHMFNSAFAYNQPLDKWNTQNALYMQAMFAEAIEFNQTLSTRVDDGETYWDISTVTNVSYMFSGATNFNNGGAKGTSDIPLAWDTSNVSNFRTMFYNNPSFNQKVDWNTSSATTMVSVFRNATSFNQDISSWDTSKITDISFIFDGAASFNNGQAAGDSTRGLPWDTSNVEQMERSFYNAKSFNQDISDWNVNKVINSLNFYKHSTFLETNPYRVPVKLR